MMGLEDFVSAAMDVVAGGKPTQEGDAALDRALRIQEEINTLVSNIQAQFVIARSGALDHQALAKLQERSKDLQDNLARDLGVHIGILPNDNLSILSAAAESQGYDGIKELQECPQLYADMFERAQEAVSMEMSPNA